MKEKKTSSEQVVIETLQELPMNQRLDNRFYDFESEEIFEIIEKEKETIKEPPVPTNAGNRFADVLADLDRLKSKLGGSPTFRGQRPSLDDADANKTFLKVPMTAVKDWFRMTLKKEWSPKF